MGQPSIAQTKKLKNKRRRDKADLEVELQMRLGADSKVKRESFRLESLKESYREKKEGLGGQTSMKDKVE